MHMHTRVRDGLRVLHGKELPGHADQRRVQFNRIDARDSGMFQRLRDAAVYAAAD